MKLENINNCDYGAGMSCPNFLEPFMLTTTMTKTEVLNELTRIDSWLAERQPGIMKKYERFFKPKNAGDRMLGISEYTTPCNNKVHVVWNTAIKGALWLEYSFYVELNTPNGKAYVKALFNSEDGNRPTDAYLYTAHAMQRLWERQGLTFKQLMELEYKESKNLHYTLPYTYKGKESWATPLGVMGLWVSVEGNWGLTHVTYVTRSQCGKEQMKSMYSSRKAIEEHQAEKDSYVTKEGLALLAGLNRRQRRQSIPRY